MFIKEQKEQKAQKGKAADGSSKARHRRLTNPSFHFYSNECSLILSMTENMLS